MADEDTLSQDDLDSLLGLGGEESASEQGGGDELNLDSLLAEDTEGTKTAGINQEALDALAGFVEQETKAEAAKKGKGQSKQGSGGDRDNIDLLLDVFVRFTVELGRTKMLIKDVLMLTEGSIVELDKMIGDEVDILINDRLFGRGKLVVIDEYFGVQITHIIDPLDRYRNL
jgi:flagellar motor switch protein FliN/FliY